MRSLYLLRHAKSSWADPALSDHERPLAPRGRRDAKRIAAHLLELGIAPELVLCSTALRTRETLELIRPALDAAAIVELEAALYAAWAETLLERLREVPDERRSVMLIGHNPGLEDLALMLASAGPERDRTRGEVPDRRARDAHDSRGDLEGAVPGRRRARRLRRSEAARRTRLAHDRARTTSEEARRVGDEIGVDWSRYDLEEFRSGMDVEFEHGSRDPQTNVTNDDPIVTGKIALAHMKEFPDYYTRLERMEKEAEQYWAGKES